MLITVTRTNKTTDGIFGNLATDTGYKCVTAENLLKEIPAGAYPVQWMYSEHFDQIMPMIVVPNRTAIEIHWANFPSQLEGCIAVGTEVELAADRIDQSKIAWRGLIQTMLNQPVIALKIVEDYA